MSEQLTYNQKDAARRMGVSPKTFQRWTKRGLIKPVVIGGVSLYTDKALVDLTGAAAATPAKGARAK
jgi:DNA-binding transcriptional MerR regulator